MKKIIHILFLFFIAIVSLGIIAKIQLGTNQNKVDTPQMDVDKLFVKVNENAFRKAINDAFGEKVKVSNRGNFIITCRKGFLIDDATKGTKEDLELLKKTAGNRFEYKKKDDLYTITLQKDDGYVDCPVMLITPILHELKDKGVTQ